MGKPMAEGTAEEGFLLQAVFSPRQPAPLHFGRNCLNVQLGSQAAKRNCLCLQNSWQKELVCYDTQDKISFLSVNFPISILMVCT